MIKRTICLTLSILMIFYFTGCYKGQNSFRNDYPVVINDIEFTSSPDKVVVMSDSLADIIIALGYDNKLLACVEDCSQSEISIIPRIPKNISEAISKIEELSPDLILLDDTINNDDIENLQNLGINTLVFSKAKNRNELINMYNNIGAIFGGDTSGREKADKISNNILMSLDDINRIIPDRDVNITACYIYGDNKIATGDTFINEIIKSSGAINIAQGSTNNYMNINDIKIANPDYIFCDQNQKEKLVLNVDFKGINAVRENRIFVINDKLINRQGNSIIDAAVFIAGIIYPELTVKDNKKLDDSSFNKNDEENIEQSIDNSSSTNNLERDILSIESRLDSLDYMPTKPDGIFNDNTIRAITDFQFINGMETTGKLDNDTLERLFSESAIKRPDPAREK